MNSESITPTTGRRLAGRRAFVTGGASGIGLASAQRLVAEGARVVITDARADSLTQAIDSCGGDAIGIACDVGDEASVASAVADGVQRLGGLDIVVACAGIVRSAATHETALDEWEMMMRVNSTGVFLTVKHTLPHLMESGGGSIVTVGSVASVVAAGRTSSYDASKGAVLQFTRAVAVEYVDRGIRANCVLPGVVATALAANSSALHGAADWSQTSGTAGRLRVPMERRADPSEIASVIAFLASDDASFVTGAAIAADGGYTAI